ncbi:MAG: heme-binding domain-containing protein [Ignavibacteriaceae bacterium]|nr:heme-binding domain-containing protein [Ignavibacteriaceae bacterium]
MKRFFANKAVKFVLLPLLVIFIGIQFISVEKTNPPVEYKPLWDSPKTEEYARRACYDCHSNETKWPWYTNIAPVSMITSHHVIDGRKHLNFSEGDLGDVEDLLFEIEQGNMPLKPYLLLHPEANFTEQEMKEFIEGLKATFKAEAEREAQLSGTN